MRCKGLPKCHGWRWGWVGGRQDEHPGSLGGGSSQAHCILLSLPSSLLHVGNLHSVQCTEGWRAMGVVGREKGVEKYAWLRASGTTRNPGRHSYQNNDSLMPRESLGWETAISLRIWDQEISWLKSRRHHYWPSGDRFHKATKGIPSFLQIQP